MYGHTMIKHLSDANVFLAGGQMETNDGFESHHLLLSFDFNSETWKTDYAQMTKGRVRPGLTMTYEEDFIIVAGGQTPDGNGYENSVEKYSFWDEVWEPCEPLPSGMEYAFVTPVDDKMVAVSNVANAVYQYDEGADEWTLKAGIVSQPVVYDASIVSVAEVYTLCGKG